MLAFSRCENGSNRTIGLVPTMGYLHDGHLSLLKLLEGQCDIKAVSIFVNPTQFGPGEDYDNYPRNIEGDLSLLEANGCDLVFIPSTDEMYPDSFRTFVDVEKLSKVLCGKYRLDHFRGVATIVLRLFMLTNCRVACFGEKDFQQARIIQRMVNDLHLPVKLIFGETIREKDGLAMSSRNRYLSDEERLSALAVPKSLEWARRAAAAGEKRIEALRNGMMDIFRHDERVKIQYIEIVDPDTLEPVDLIKEAAQAAVAVYVGKTRLIDNISIGIKAKTKPIGNINV